MLPSHTSGPSTSTTQCLPPDGHDPDHDLQVPDDAPAPPTDMFDPGSASATVPVAPAAEAQLQPQRQLQVGSWWDTAVEPPQPTQTALHAMPQPPQPQPQPYISTFDPPPQSIALASTFDTSHTPSACTTASIGSNTNTWDISHSPLAQTHQATSSWETYPFPPLPFFPDTPAVYANATATAPATASVPSAAVAPDSAPAADDLAGVTTPVPVLPFRTTIDGTPSHPSTISLSLASFAGSLGEDDSDMPLSAVGSSWSSEPSSSALDSAVAMMAAMSGTGSAPDAGTEGLVNTVSNTGSLATNGTTGDAQPLQWQGSLLNMPGGPLLPAAGFTSDLLPQPPPSQFLDEEPAPSFPLAQWDCPLPGGHSFFPRVDPSRPTSRGRGKGKGKSDEPHISPPTHDMAPSAVPPCGAEGLPAGQPMFTVRNMSPRFQTLAPVVLPSGLEQHLAPPINFSLQPPPPEFMLGVRPSTSLPLLTQHLPRYGTMNQLPEAPRVNGWIPPQDRAIPPRPRRPVPAAFLDVICPRECLPGASAAPVPQHESMSPEDEYRMRRGMFAPSVNTSANVWSHLPPDFGNDQDDSPPLTPSTPRSPSYEREAPLRIPTVPSVPAPAPPPVRYTQAPPTGTVSNGSSPRSKSSRRKKGSMNDKENKSSPKSNRATLSERRVWPCPHCSMRFTRRSDLDRHAKTKHNPHKVGHHYCPVCNYSHAREDKFNSHMATAHPLFAAGSALGGHGRGM